MNTRRRSLLIAVMVAAVACVVVSVLWMRARRVTRLADGVVSTTLRLDGIRFKAVSVAPDRASIDLLWKDPGGTLIGDFEHARRLLHAQGREMLFATNAGIFTRERVPLGLHVEAGVERVPINRSEGEGNFYLNPNGVFLIDETGPHIVTTDEYDSTRPSPRIALQSGPLLVRAGSIHPSINAGSDNLRIRSGVGVDAAGHVVFLISQDPCNFDQFARCFHDELHCPDALYLDGAISQFYLSNDSPNAVSQMFAGMLTVTVPASR